MILKNDFDWWSTNDIDIDFKLKIFT